MIGHERRQMRFQANRSHAGATAAVRNAESFVQIHMADIGTDQTGRSQADLGVEVGAVHVNLPAVRVHHGANILDCLFKDAMRRGVGNHQAGQMG